MKSNIDLQAHQAVTELLQWEGRLTYGAAHSIILTHMTQLLLDNERKYTDLLQGNVSKMEALLASFTSPTQG